MGRRAARATHLALSLLGAALYFVFLIPRWWVLTGDLPDTLATAGRIAAGVPVAAAAVPVALALQRSLKTKTPEPALRLRAWSAVLHVVAGILMIAAAVAEIWLGLGAAGPWLFGVYGAAGAIAALAILAFVLSFTAEKPPAPPKPAKAKNAKREKPARRRDRKQEAAPAEDGQGDTATEADETGEDGGEVTEKSDDTPAEPETTADAEEPEAESPDGLLNKRPAGRRRLRLRR